MSSAVTNEQTGLLPANGAKSDNDILCELNKLSESGVCAYVTSQKSSERSSRITPTSAEAGWALLTASVPTWAHSIPVRKYHGFRRTCAQLSVRCSQRMGSSTPVKRKPMASNSIPSDTFGYSRATAAPNRKPMRSPIWKAWISTAELNRSDSHQPRSCDS